MAAIIRIVMPGIGCDHSRGLLQLLSFIIAHKRLPFLEDELQPLHS